ncbi:MAG TPA: hypothetical protein VNS32_23395 [Flavisolibacter sp.]|nr:hypothetical protein [Flavisolibacter sp.]
MTWNSILGVACTISFLFPVAVIAYNRFYTHRSLSALLVYYLMTAVYILMSEQIIPTAAVFIRNYALVNNYLDAPLMLTSLLFFCPGRQKQRKVWILAFLFVVYEIVITMMYGFTGKAMIKILGPGICIILGYTFYLFVHQVKFSVMHRKNQGRMVMLAAILFAYSCYGLTYYFYYIQKTPYKADALSIYYVSSFVASTMMGVGLHLMRKRMKELRSLKITRRELAVFFGHDRKSVKMAKG